MKLKVPPDFLSEHPVEIRELCAQWIARLGITEVRNSRRYYDQVVIDVTYAGLELQLYLHRHGESSIHISLHQGVDVFIVYVVFDIYGKLTSVAFRLAQGAYRALRYP